MFGEIIDGVPLLSQFGSLAEGESRRLEKRFSQIRVDEWIVMPNHLHGILWIVEYESFLLPRPYYNIRHIIGCKTWLTKRKLHCS
jgi:REP element-mobilizing transposase RayT